MSGDRLIGYAIAGGRSARMGRDKSLLPWNDGSLLDHALSRLGAVCEDVRILSGTELRYADRGVPVVVDRDSDAGPLGGLFAGLSDAAAAGAVAGVFLAVDLPLVPAALLSRLAGMCSRYDAVVPVTDRGPEPVCAVYAARCANAIRRRIDAGEVKTTAFWRDVRVRLAFPGELADFGDPGRLFENVNSLEDYERLRPRPANATGVDRLS